MGDRHRDALAQANLPAGHILSFNNALYFVFAGLEPDRWLTAVCLLWGMETWCAS